MSRSQSGSRYSSLSKRFEILESSQVGEARRYSQQIARDLEFDEVQMGKVGIVVNELASNLHRHAKSGELLLRTFTFGDHSFFEVLSLDLGPGFFDLNLSMQDGYSTGGTPGTGMGAIQRQSDYFDVYSDSKGTVILSVIGSGKTPFQLPEYYVAGISVPVGAEVVSGDGWDWIEHEGQHSLVLVDGLGHGLLAHEAAVAGLDACADALASSTLNLDLIMKQIHARMRSTRGGAVSILQPKFLDQSISHLGVGNIRCLILTDSILRTLISYPGTVGLNYQNARQVQLPLAESSILIAHSDGIGTKWEVSPRLAACHPALIAGVLFRDFRRGNDDATLVIAKRWQ